jgi:hypothetical protein
MSFKSFFHNVGKQISKPFELAGQLEGDIGDGLTSIDEIFRWAPYILLAGAAGYVALKLL